MPLSPDPSELFQIVGFVGINFAMFDGPTRVLCRVSWEALQDRAALDRTDQNDLSGTFDRYRHQIERTASDRYDRGEAPLVRSGEF